MADKPAKAMEPPSEPASAAGNSGRRIRLSSPSFYAFLIAQFLSAANDNAFQITLVLFILSVISGEARQITYSSLVTALLPVAFLLFSPLAGYFSDRFPKHHVLFWTKLPAIVVMALATVGFAIRSVPFLLGVLFLAATRAAFFSPAKYGILPEIFDDRDLSNANGVVELTTDLGILLGSIAGIYAYGLFRSHLVGAGLILVGSACLSTIAILFVPRAPMGNPDARFAWNVVGSFGQDLEQVRHNPALYYIVLGIAWFGFLGSFFLTVIPVFGRSALRLPEERVGILLAVLSIGVGLGSVVAARLSRRRVEIGLVPLGSIGITVFALMLSGSGHGRWLPGVQIPVDTAAELTLLGLASGFFIIPLNAMLQQRAPSGMKGRLIAFANVLTFGAVLAAAALPWMLAGLFGLRSRQAILVVALLTLGATVYVVRLLPDFLVRLILWLVTNILYRLRTVGEEHVPAEGALLVANHVSWVDAILVGAASDRMVRFLMLRPHYEWKGLHWFFRMMHAIPVAATDPREKLTESLEMARHEIREGHAVCIFAEGAISHTGNLLRFRRGLERIVSGIDCPIVPVYLDGVWGSIFSFERGRFLFKRPRRIFQPVTVFFGPALPSTAHAYQVRQAIQELSVEAFESHKSSQRPLHIGFISRAKRRWRGVLAADSRGRRVTFGTALVKAIAMSQTLWQSGPKGEERVGVLLPPGIDAMLANLAIYLAGRVPVNLDCTEPGDIARSMVESADIGEVVTSRSFLDALAFVGRLSDRRLRFLEDLNGSGGRLGAIRLRLACRLLPSFLVTRLFVRGDRHSVDRLATILYSYPPDDPDHPRGAMLTHHNLLSNRESLRQVFRVTHEDCVLGLLPFSNAMGFSGTFLLPALTGARVVYAAETAGGPELGHVCRDERVTLIPASPQLLSMIVENVPADALSHLRYVAVGGGELDKHLHESFVKKFGVEPLEGYGCPECAPIVSLNLPDYVKGRERQAGTHRGTEGHPLPGISVRIVDRASGQPLPQGTEGLLLVRGPNVMQGYVNGAELTRKVLVDGWYVTGDLATLDFDGFIRVAPRDPAT